MSDPRSASRPDSRHCPQYCQECGASDWETRVPRRDDKPRQCCRACGYVHYVGPVLAAGIILRCISRSVSRSDDRYCLVRRAHEPAKGKWSFPGGFVDLGEEPAAAAEREALEETGVEVRAGDLVGLYRSQGPGGKDVVIAVYMGDVDADATHASATHDWTPPSEEVAAIEWFAVEEIPWDQIAFASTATALRTTIATRSP